MTKLDDNEINLCVGILIATAKEIEHGKDIMLDLVWNSPRIGLSATRFTVDNTGGKWIKFECWYYEDEAIRKFKMPFDDFEEIRKKLDTEDFRQSLIKCLFEDDKE